MAMPLVNMSGKGSKRRIKNSPPTSGYVLIHLRVSSRNWQGQFWELTSSPSSFGIANTISLINL